jgi:hypothetical protein
VCVDLDATLVTAHSDKQGATGTYKRGFGHHPIGAWLDRGDGAGEALAMTLRPGNAGANNADDHVDVLEAALAALPDLPDEARLLVRADSAGCTHAFLAYARHAGVGFSVGYRLGHAAARHAVRTLHDDDDAEWVPAVRQDGTVRDGAAVAEATALVDLSAWPSGSRLIVRREPLHPGAQQTLDDVDGYRFTAFLTDQPDTDLAELDRRHRGHARVEDRIRAAKRCGLAKLPSADFAINTVWVQLALCAADLLTFFALVCCPAPLRLAEPDTLRYKLLHVAGRLVRSGRRLRLRIDADWPWADALVTAFTRLHALPALP